MNNLTNQQLNAANASIFDAQKPDEKKAVKVLRELADSCDTDWAAENLETSADIIEAEVL